MRTRLAAALLLVTVASSAPATADVKATASFYPGSFDVALGGQPLLERVSFEVKPRAADLGTPCAWDALPAAAAGLDVACRAGGEAVHLRVDERAPGVAVVSAELPSETPLAAEDGLALTVAVAGFESGLAYARSEPWWLRPVFFSQQNFIPGETQLVLARRAKDYVAVLPLAAGGALGFARGANLSVAAGGIRIGMDAYAPWSIARAPLAVIAVAESPYAAVAAAYRHGLEAMGRPGRLRTEKSYPEPLTRVGFCTWNSFYEEQTAANLEGAARAFGAAHFPLGFFIVDAGWQDATQGMIFFRRLRSFEADRAKMPGGLGQVVANIKRLSGAKWVGVWHGFQGVPGGVDPGSPLAAAEAAHLWQGAEPGLVPDPRSAVGADFYRDFYRYLRSSGVDLVKVDFQNWLEPYLRGRLPLFSAMQQSAYNLQSAAKESFGDRLIDCMSMGHDVLFNLRDTNVVRNSLDYLLPPGPFGHRRHAVNNVFNSLLVQQVAYPDFDMWEAYGDFATYHSVLRALSGGPVYVTGDVAKQDFGLVRRLIASDGTVLRTDEPGLPTRDVLFVDAEQVPVPLKAFARVGASGLVGAFNALQSGGSVAGVVRASDVDGLAGRRYAAVEYFSRHAKLVDRDEPLDVRLDTNAVALYWFAPLENGAAVIGLVEKYVAPRTVVSRRDEGATLHVGVADAGTLGVVFERAPRSATVDGAPVSMTHEGDLWLVPVAGAAGPHEVAIAR